MIRCFCHKIEIIRAFVFFRTTENIAGTLQCWCCSRPPAFSFSPADISKTFPFRLAYTWVLFKAFSLKASCSFTTVSAADFPNRKQSFTHTHCWHVYVLGRVYGKKKSRNIVTSSHPVLIRVWCNMMLEQWNLLETLTLTLATYTRVGAECGRGGDSKS